MKEMMSAITPETTNILTLTHNHYTNWMDCWGDTHDRVANRQGFVLLDEITRSATQQVSPSPITPEVSYITVEDPTDTGSILQATNLFFEDWQATVADTLVVLETLHDTLSTLDLEDALYNLHQIIQTARRAGYDVHAFLDISEIELFEVMAAAPLFDDFQPCSSVSDLILDDANSGLFYHLSEAISRNVFAVLLSLLEDASEDTIELDELIDAVREDADVESHRNVQSENDVNLLLRHVLLPKLQRLGLLVFNEYEEEVELLVDIDYARSYLTRAETIFAGVARDFSHP